MKLWMTQSLLSSWMFFLNADEEYAEAAFDSFLRTLRREKTEPSQAMLDGIAFEDMVNAIAAGKLPPMPSHRRMTEATLSKWTQAAEAIAKYCKGGQSQTELTGEVRIGDTEFVLYGLADYVKAGTIIDVKKVTRYEYGKYQHSPQHPMYLHLLSPASKFTYLIFDGERIHRETYRREDAPDIETTIKRFLFSLADLDLLDEYYTHWEMNDERELKISGAYKEEKDVKSCCNDRALVC